MTERMRMLNRDLDMSKYQETAEGLLVKDVPLLAVGIWTDSNIGTPLYYGAGALKQYAANWQANGYWARHAGGAPRSILDLIGEVRDPRYDAAYIGPGQTEPGAVVGDVFYSYSTQQGRDAAAQAIARAKAGKPLAVSVEHGGDERWNPSMQRSEAMSLTFYGLASVERGACESCKLPKRMDEKPPQTEENDMDEASIQKALSDAKAEILGEVDKRLSALKIPVDASETVKGLEAQVKALSEQLGQKEDRIKALELKPNPKGRLNEQEDRDLEVEAPQGRIVVKGGIVCREV